MPLKRATERIRGHKLQERNARLAEANPLCVHCTQQGKVSIATQWDHVIPLHKGGLDVESNLQGLCDECHYRKTVADCAYKIRDWKPNGLDWIC